VGVQSREGGVAGLPILDAAFDGPGDLYVVPVVVSPDGNTPYVAAARLSRGPAGQAGAWALTQVYAPRMQANENIHLDGLREVEVDGHGLVYVLNVGRQNQSDAVLVFDAAAGREGTRRELYGLGLESPAGMRVSERAGCLYVGGARAGQGGVRVLALRLGNLDRWPISAGASGWVDVAGMDQVTDLAEDGQSGRIWAVGLSLQDVPAEFDSKTLRDILNRTPFYLPRVAGFTPGQSEQVQAWTPTGPGCDLALPLAIAWTGTAP
jgi:hypothetical protein